MAYVQEIFRTADKEIIIVKKHHSLFAMPTNEKIKQRRKPKVDETNEKQQKINERHRKERNFRLLADNFHAGDYYITLPTAEKMQPEEFKNEMKNFMKRLRREYSRRMNGEKIKYFRVLENMAGQGRPHGHILVSKFCDPDLIRGIIAQLWTAGNAKVEIYGGTAQDAYNVASYFSKQDKKEHGAKIDTSRGNLIRRDPKKEIIHRETFRDEIKAPKGYFVVKPLSYNTTTETGFAYQVAVFQKIKEAKSANDGLGKAKSKSNKKVSGSGKQKSRLAARKND